MKVPSYDEFLNESAVTEYINMLKNFDWNYQQSDDHRAYAKGKVQWDEIEQMAKKYDPDGKIMAKYRPKQNKAPKSNPQTKVTPATPVKGKRSIPSDKDRMAGKKMVDDLAFQLMKKRTSQDT